jgi:hypothetical protein
MNEQISFSLSDEVAPYFNSDHITELCHLIDLKASQGKKYRDFKELLLARLQAAVDLTNPSDDINIYRRAYEFAKYY